jgi:hypothetical protein
MSARIGSPQQVYEEVRLAFQEIVELKQSSSDVLIDREESSRGKDGIQSRKKPDDMSTIVS